MELVIVKHTGEMQIVTDHFEDGFIRIINMARTTATVTHSSKVDFFS